MTFRIVSVFSQNLKIHIAILLRIIYPGTLRLTMSSYSWIRGGGTDDGSSSDAPVASDHPIFPSSSSHHHRHSRRGGAAAEEGTVALIPLSSGAITAGVPDMTAVASASGGASYHTAAPAIVVPSHITSSAGQC